MVSQTPKTMRHTAHPKHHKGHLLFVCKSILMSWSQSWWVLFLFCFIKKIYREREITGLAHGWLLLWGQHYKSIQLKISLHGGMPGFCNSWLLIFPHHWAPDAQLPAEPGRWRRAERKLGELCPGWRKGFACEQSPFPHVCVETMWPDPFCFLFCFTKILQMLI